MKLSELLNKHSFKFSKKFGQNFISDLNLLDKIVNLSGITENDVVLEIGCGAGTLTKELAKKAKFVFGYEIDKTLQPVLAENLGGVENCEITFRDVMREKTADIEKHIGEEYVIVANLPYYITSPLVMKFIEQSQKCKAIVIMVQLEVAERFCALPGTPEYGAITAGINAVADCEKLLFVPREMFYPRPNVDSEVVKIVFNKNKHCIASREVYRETVRAAFSSRRKTLANNLSQGLKISKAQAENLILSCDLDPSVRGETLSSDRFCALSNAVVSYREKQTEKNG